MSKFFGQIADFFRAFFAPEPVLDPDDPMAPGNWADPAWMDELFGDDDVPF